jgi:hypothetical protein
MRRAVPLVRKNGAAVYFPSQKQPEENADPQNEKTPRHETRGPDADAQEKTDDPENGQNDKKQKSEWKQ